MDDELRERLRNCVDERLTSTLGTVEGKHEEDIGDLVEARSNDPVESGFQLDDAVFVYVQLAASARDSVAKQIGHLFEDLVDEIIEYQFGLSDEETTYSEVVENGDRVRRKPDQILLFNLLSDSDAEGLREVAEANDESLRAFREDQEPLRGIGLELKKGKRANDATRKAGIKATATHMKDNDILPVMLVFSGPTNVGSDDNWIVYQGEAAFEMVDEITGVDLLEFLEDEQEFISERMGDVTDAFGKLFQTYTEDYRSSE
jgi:hypothetical protein